MRWETQYGTLDREGWIAPSWFGFCGRFPFFFCGGIICYLVSFVGLSGLFQDSLYAGISRFGFQDGLCFVTHYLSAARTRGLGYSVCGIHGNKLQE